MSTYGYLAHHGVKGQKWGIRRYQNADGSLTDAGKKRYYDSNGKEKYIYPVVTGKRIGIGRASVYAGKLMHPHGKKMSLKKADKYLQKSLDKNYISDVYKDGSYEMVKLTEKGAKKLNLLGRFPKDAERKAGESVTTDYYIQMQKSFGKDISDRVLKTLGALGVSAAILGGTYAYKKTKGKGPSMSSIKEIINKSIDNLDDVEPYKKSKIHDMTDEEFDEWVKKEN